jgi:hypothetical protein
MGLGQLTRAETIVGESLGQLTRAETIVGESLCKRQRSRWRFLNDVGCTV